MFSLEARQLLGLILDLFSQTSKIPIGFYEYDGKGTVVETLRSDDSVFPEYCQTIWKLSNGKGKDLCVANMCGRAKQVIDSIKTSELICHAGLFNNTDPIMISGGAVAAIQYGAYLLEEKLTESLQQCEIFIQESGVDKVKAEEIRATLEHAPIRRKTQELKTLRATLSPILRNVIETYILQQENSNVIKVAAMHEIQLRLQAILARAENLLEQLDKESEAYHSIEDIISATEACGTSIHNLTTGDYLPQKYIFRHHEIKKFIDRAVSLCKPEARKKGVDIVINLSPDGGRFFIDASESHLQQAFNNIVQNAIKYSYRTTEYSDKRYIKIIGKLENKGYEIVVSNYGVGIQEDEYTLIFEGGYKGRLTLAEYRTGSGRGLSLSKQIINKHNGTIIPYSEPKGNSQEGGIMPYLTFFRIWLPLRQQRDEG